METMTLKSIPEQLTDIYLNEENWHTFKMPYKEALEYHRKRLKSGEIEIYQENGKVFGYYQRHFVYNVCFFDNTWIKKDYRRNEVFKILHKRFMSTLPKNITMIMGERQKNLHKVKIRRQQNGFN